jgi:hypothetical protein
MYTCETVRLVKASSIMTLTPAFFRNCMAGSGAVEVPAPAVISVIMTYTTVPVQNLNTGMKRIFFFN